MKHLIVIHIIIISFSFTIRKPKKFIPPGTVQIHESFFADQTEISNFSWQEYELWTKHKYGSQSSQHIATLPDTLVWREKSAYNEPYVQYYYRHPAYKDYPVVGISYDQAVSFCKWRTERVKEFGYFKNKKEIKLEYRLPTKEEWEILTYNGQWEFSNKGKDEKGYTKMNIPRDSSETNMGNPYFKTVHADVTTPVKSFHKNPYGLYNIIGNVAEMIEEKGICKGGGWRTKMEDCRVGKDIQYFKPEAWLGFRCVCTINNNL